MSDSSGFTNFPPGPRLSGQERQNSAPAERPNARLVGVPEDLREIRQPTKIRGEVVRQTYNPRTRETNLRIRTERGDIEVRLPPEQPAPRPGQKVEVELHPGRPPTQARIEQAPTTPVDERHAQRAVTPQTTMTTPRAEATPVNLELGTAPPSRPETRPAPPPETIQTLPKTLPSPDTLVRLQPIAPRELLPLIVAQPLPEIINAVVTSIPQTQLFETQIIAQQTVQTPLNQLSNIILQPTETAQQILQTQTTSLPPTTPNLNPLTEPLLALNPDIVLTPTALTAETPLSTAPLQQSAQPALSTFYSAAPPPLQINSQIARLTPSITTPNIAQTPPGSAAFAPPPASNIPAAQPLDIRINAVQPPPVELVIPGTQNTQTSATPSTTDLILGNNSPNTISGTVIGTAPENLPIISLFFSQGSDAQNFILQSPVLDIPSGTQLQITPQTPLASAPQITAPGAPALAFPPATLLSPGSWPVMEELYQTLAQTAPTVAQAFSNIVPNAAAPAQITPAALFFIAAIRGGDISQWLGERATDILRNSGRTSALSRLTQEGGMLSRLAAEPVSQDWRAVPIPMFYEGEIQKLALYYKHDYPDSQREQTEGKTTRFVFDLSLDQMGKVQVDGLFHPGRLDVVVRTEDHLSQAMQMDMRQTYAKALRQTEVTGELTFQNQPEQWVTIQIENKDGFGVEA